MPWAGRAWLIEGQVDRGSGEGEQQHAGPQEYPTREKEYLPPFPGSGGRSFHDTSCVPKPSPRPSGPSTALTPHQDSLFLKVPLALATLVTQLSTVPREV